MTLKDADSERGKINGALYTNLSTETKSWGLEIVRTELKEINPPAGVQETMNKMVKASNEKIAAVDFATARETQAEFTNFVAVQARQSCPALGLAPPCKQHVSASQKTPDVRKTLPWVIHMRLARVEECQRCLTGMSIFDQAGEP
jgi:hypothetical protein